MLKPASLVSAPHNRIAAVTMNGGVKAVICNKD